MQRLFRAAAITAFFVGMSVAAKAADLPVAPAPAYKAPAMMAPIFSWTGFYLGGNLGIGWQNGNVTDNFFGVNWNANNNATSVGGGQVWSSTISLAVISLPASRATLIGSPTTIIPPASRLSAQPFRAAITVVG